MVVRSPAAASLVALLLVTVPLTGCVDRVLGGGDGARDDNETPLNTSQNRSTPNATLPQNRGESAGLKETNKTEEGIGGVDHKHDYWKGRSQIIVHDQLVNFSATPVYPDGEGSEPKSVAYAKLPPPNLIYEGAATVELTVREPVVGAYDLGGDYIVTDVPSTHTPGTANPAPPGYFAQYRSAADSEWRDVGPLPLDQTVSIPVEAHETDMPHSTSSLWVFRLTTDRADESQVHLTVVVYKGKDVEDWPGHPDFYGESNSRVVLDRDVSTYMSGAQEGVLYDAGGTWVYPDFLISHGTTRVEVFANVTAITNQFGAKATGYFLEVHNATYIGPEVRFGDRYSDGDDTNDLVSYNFTIPVDQNGMDGPYQQQSRWGFRLMATFTDVDVPGVISIGFCPGCFPYEIDYHITVIAVGDKAAPIGDV